MFGPPIVGSSRPFVKPISRTISSRAVQRREFICGRSARYHSLSMLITRTYTKTLPVSAQTAMDWHERPAAFDRLNPPWQRIEVFKRTGGIHTGDQVLLRFKLAGLIPFMWRIEHRGYEPGRKFEDHQISGPFRSWTHIHEMTPADDSSCLLSDTIRYSLPLGRIGHLLLGRFTGRSLDAAFQYRQQMTHDDLLFQTLFNTNGDSPTMRIAITGASGLVGRALTSLLTTGGHEVIRLVRQPTTKADEVQWNPNGDMDATSLARLEGIDAIVHLAGENIAGGRWTTARMARIRNSRIEGTKNLIANLEKLDQPPRVIVAASAIGVFGDRGNEILTEQSKAGTGYLADVCTDWESATHSEPLRNKGTRTVIARLGVVLTPQGGALKKMLLPFKMGAGGRLGSGKQWFSWVSLDDTITAIQYALMTESISGLIHVVSPNAVTNKDFTSTLGRVLHRPTIVPMPAFAARLAFSKGLANEALLASQRVEPAALLAHGFTFRDSELEPALVKLLGKT